jgi:DnaK suppressor protein
MAITLRTLLEKLRVEKQRLLEEIEGLAYLHHEGLGTTAENEHYSNHPAEVASETFEQEKDLALEMNLRRLLQRTTDALRRFDQGTYGICSDCAQPIPLDRLDAVPQATLCVKCKMIQEAQH